MDDTSHAKRTRSSLIRRYLLTGLLIWIPLGVTLFIVQIFADYLGDLIELFPDAWQPKVLIGIDIPGLEALLGIVLVATVLLLTGFIASNFLGRQLLQLGEEILEHIPLVRSIYSAAKQISETMFSNKGKSFRKVVLIRYPQKETWSLAFQTSDTLGELNAKVPGQMISVFVPTTPNPTSGFLLMVPPEDVIELEMNVDEALKMIISLGVIVPVWPRPDKAAASGLAPKGPAP
jgi:uncharacterized membrane protein